MRWRNRRRKWEMCIRDRDLVYQVIYNLVDNAIKFCNVGGEIRFSVTQSLSLIHI